MPTTDLEPPNPAESYPAEALANEELNARSIREVPLQDLVKTIFASRRGSARPPALRRLHATSAIAAGRARGEGAGTLTALAAETGEAGTQEPSGAVAGAEAEASEEEGEGEAGETEAEPATEGEAASKPVKRAKRKYIKDFTKEKGARLDDDIGLVDRGVAKADADAIAASAAAATAAAASASDQLDTGVPGSQASSILSLPRFRDVERTFSRHRPIWVDQDRPDVRMNLCVTVVGATSDRPQVIGSGVSMPGKVLRKAQTSRINGGGKRPGLQDVPASHSSSSSCDRCPGRRRIIRLRLRYPPSPARNPSHLRLAHQRHGGPEEGDGPRHQAVSCSRSAVRYGRHARRPVHGSVHGGARQRRRLAARGTATGLPRRRHAEDQGHVACGRACHSSRHRLPCSWRRSARPRRCW
ncbi:hypothetical protein AAT19DRAFT_9333 [Rhodotorula toruloides]|uniref:Uncharacterized protein n=1 Tax=Rhodotorula toruloides TaxID=5286 RepID=A0A2T0A1W3_RHOTO|nr:hypothetical protein AAT19DRAFT_9333 [Rhodotorula toruloides]